MYYLKFEKLNIVFTEKKDGNMRDPQVRRRIASDFGFTDIFVPKQKHTPVITDPENLNIDADGIFTDKKKLPVGILTADCLAVVISDMEKLVVLHAGWRGLFNGIVENGLDNFSDKRELAVFLSPHAMSCCYQVREDFLEDAERSGISEKYFTYRDGNIYFSMRDLVIDRLESYGIKRVIDVSLCTICDDNFFSYRKGDFENRILTFSWLSEE
ncbi:polyphenol oxidase family protein [Persephonella sp.]